MHLYGHLTSLFTSAEVVVLSVLFVCLSTRLKEKNNTTQIFLKLGGRAGHGPKTSTYCVVDLDKWADPGLFESLCYTLHDLGFVHIFMYFQKKNTWILIVSFLKSQWYLEGWQCSLVQIQIKIQI